MDFGNFDEAWCLGHGKLLGSGMLLGQTINDWKQFERRSKEESRHPTFSVFVESQGDITAVVQNYRYKRTLVGGTNMIAEPNYGTGTVTIVDPDGIYVDNGRPVFRRGKRVYIFAGFDNDHIPRFSGVIRGVSLQTDLKTITLNIADDGYNLRKAKTGGDKSPYNTPLKLIDYLIGLINIGEVIYENESGRPTTVEFGDTNLETRTYWALIHGACLVLGYRQFLDEVGKLNIVLRNTFEDTGYVFTDKEIRYLRYHRPVDIINNRIVGFSLGLTMPFLCGDFILGVGSTSFTNSLSKRKYGERSNAESEEMIGSIQNAISVVNQDLEYCAHPRDLFLMATAGIPQLQLADRVFVNHTERNMTGFYDIVEIEEYGAAGNLNNIFTLMNQGDRF